MNSYNADTSVSGAESYIHTTKPVEAAELSRIILKSMEKSTGIKNRGVKTGTVADAKACTISPTDLAIIFSLQSVALNPVTLVRVSTGISKASQNFTKSAAFLAPLAERVPSEISVLLPSAS